MSQINEIISTLFAPRKQRQVHDILDHAVVEIARHPDVDKLTLEEYNEIKRKLDVIKEQNYDRDYNCVYLGSIYLEKIDMVGLIRSAYCDEPQSFIKLNEQWTYFLSILQKLKKTDITKVEDLLPNAFSGKSIDLDCIIMPVRNKN